ncbi:hypothetical protein EDB80DRAFT_649599 [Ilyonectria destructans]|nr:hypothetical protein EDB80DRAFT_649599 [Ilyonectria destructans]
MADPKESGGSESDSRLAKRTRNRLSQQAFRKRQSMYIKDLERRLEIQGSTDNDHIFRLETDNRLLREQLTAAVNKLDIVQNTLNSLSNAMSQSIRGDQDRAHSPPSHDTHPDVSSEGEPKCSTTRPAQHRSISSNSATTSTTPPNHSIPEDDIISESQFDFSDLLRPIAISARTDGPTGDIHNQLNNAGLSMPALQLDQTSMDVVPSVEYACAPWISEPTDIENSTMPYIHTAFPLDTLPGIWSHQYQMGPAAFQSRQRVPVNGRLGSNSAFSDHLGMLRRSLKRTWGGFDPALSAEDQFKKLRASADIMLSLFNSLSRPGALNWYTATNYSRNIADLTIWQLSRSRDMYSRLHLKYRPSALQLSKKYPSIIDWSPFPSIRNRLICLHSANPDLDRIMCDIATAYVVEVHQSQLLFQASGHGYIRLWDLICAMKKPDEQDSNISPQSAHEGLAVGTSTGTEIPGQSPAHQLPAPSLKSLFTRRHAEAAFKALGLDDGVPRFKLDPALFIQYPELYDPDADLIPSGTPIAPPSQTRIPPPTPPNPATSQIYRHWADWCVTSMGSQLTETDIPVFHVPSCI